MTKRYSILCFNKAILPWAVALFLMNIMGLATFSILRRLPPTQEVRVTATQKFLVVYGKNKIGFFSIRQFSHWGELSDYMFQNKLALPVITHTSLTGIHDAAIVHKKILWGSGVRRKVIHAPDILSAQIILQHMRFEGIDGGTFGYSLTLK